MRKQVIITGTPLLKKRAVFLFKGMIMKKCPFCAERYRTLQLNADFAENGLKNIKML